MVIIVIADSATYTVQRTRGVGANTMDYLSLCQGSVYGKFPVDQSSCVVVLYGGVTVGTAHHACCGISSHNTHTSNTSSSSSSNRCQLFAIIQPNLCDLTDRHQCHQYIIHDWSFGVRGDRLLIFLDYLLNCFQSMYSFCMFLFWGIILRKFSW